MSEEIQTAAGSQLHISDGVPATWDDAGFSALTWVKIDLVSDLGSGFSKKYAEVTFQPLAKRETIRLKGSFDLGSSDVTYGFNPGDAGQIMLNEAANSDDLYSFKIVLQDGYTIYCQGLVMGDPINIGTIDNVVTKSSTINMQSAGRGFVYVAAP